MKVALLEDDAKQAELVMQWLGEAGIDVSHGADGRLFLNMFKQNMFDMAILDWELPDQTGLDVLRQLRVQQEQSLPVIFTTQRDAEADIVNALNSGADDYLIKPLRKAELLARIEAARRRAGIASNTDHLCVGNIKMDNVTKTVSVDNKLVKVTPKEYAIAFELLSRQGQVLSREYLLKQVWGINAELNTRTVDMHVSRVRRTLRINPEMGYRINNIFQHGYRLEKIEVPTE